jgi:uncharacterized protein (DUF1697 family)
LQAVPKYVAFLRAINVGGHVVKMDDLRRRFEKLGFAEVQTFIASGNVIFTSPSKDGRALELKIEKALEKAFGYEVRTFVRTEAEVAKVAAYAPFTPAQVKAARAYCVGFLEGPLNAEQVKAVMALRTVDDDLHINGRELYWVGKNGQGESEFSNALLERTLKSRSTFRGMSTVVKLVAKHGCRP